VGGKSWATGDLRRLGFARGRLFDVVSLTIFLRRAEGRVELYLEKGTIFKVTRTGVPGLESG